MRSLARVVVVDRSQAAEARRIAVALAESAGFDEHWAGRVAVAITEAGTNIAKHTPGGEILLSTQGEGRSRRLEILAIDRGPGMDIDRCLADGFSTAGTRGEGLGAIARLASEFDAYSDPKGTVLFAAFAPETQSLAGSQFVVGSARAPKNGETACGDDWAMISRRDSLYILVADGLGHGPFAAEASAEAAKALESTSFASPADAVSVIHGALRGTRGAAIAVAEITASAEVRFSGLGNISGLLFSAAGTQHLVSMNGTAGHQAAKINQYQYPWPEGAMLIMHSDGLLTHWNLDRSLRVLSRSPSVIAGVIYRDYARGRDDATVVVAKRR